VAATTGGAAPGLEEPAPAQEKPNHGFRALQRALPAAEIERWSMGRRKTGTVLEPDGKRKSFALRFTAYGKRHFVTLGRPEEGWTRSRAETELRHVLAGVESGTWTPRREIVRHEVAEETFHEFSSRWIREKESEVKERTLEDYRWALEYHLLPFFKDALISQITVRDVDDYRTWKAREGRLSNNSINSTITKLSMILGAAEEYDLISSNPAAGRRRRLKGTKSSGRFVEPEQLPSLLRAAQDLGGSYGPIARPLLETLALGGLRIGEALALTWADLSLGSRTLRVSDSKTDAGHREVDLLPSLATTLTRLRADFADEAASDFVFGSRSPRGDTTSKTAQIDRHRVRNRILHPSVRAANTLLAGSGIDPIMGAQLHGLRRTFASLRLALGEDSVYVCQQLGHTDPTFTMRVYARVIRRREKLSGAALLAYDEAMKLAESGTEVTLGNNLDEGRGMSSPSISTQRLKSR
jgi:integrase